MKPVKIKLRGKAPRYFDNMSEAIEWTNEVMAKDTLDERLTITLPSWLKRELRERKGRVGVAMSAQARAWLLKGTQ